MDIQDIFRGGAYLQDEAARVFGRFQSEAKMRNWLKELDTHLIWLYGDDTDDPERREKAIMMVVETVGGKYLAEHDRADDRGAWYMRARGDWQLAACCGVYDVGARHCIAGRLGLDDFSNNTHRQGVAAAIRQVTGSSNFDPFEEARVDYGADVHPVFLTIAKNDLAALADLKPSKLTDPSAELSIHDRLTRLETEIQHILSHLGIEGGWVKSTED